MELIALVTTYPAEEGGGIQGEGLSGRRVTATYNIHVINDIFYPNSQRLKIVQKLVEILFL
jgi:hypothetical protein